MSIKKPPTTGRLFFLRRTAMTHDPQTYTDTDTDTHSPWYECFEPQAQGAPEPAAPSAQAQAAYAVELIDDDGAMDALFDYYNA